MVWSSVWATGDVICVSLDAVVLVAMAIVRVIILYIIDIIFSMEFIRNRYAKFRLMLY